MWWLLGAVASWGKLKFGCIQHKHVLTNATHLLQPWLAHESPLVCFHFAQARPNANAILLTTEITTPAYYKGKDKHRQVTNMIFRTGANSSTG